MGGLTFTASPATELVIPTGYLADRSKFTDNITETITIPNGVKVIEVYGYAYMINETHYGIQMKVKSNNKVWAEASGDEAAEFNRYIGVTSNKQYTINMYAISRMGDDYTIETFYIKYSPEINKQTPTVTDY